MQGERLEARLAYFFFLFLFLLSFFLSAISAISAVHFWISLPSSWGR